MTTGDGSAIIPAAQVEDAMMGARRHIEAVRGSARWLWENKHYATSTYFSILCMEEISKYRVMSGCRLENMGVTKEDLETIDGHEKKIAKFLEFALPSAHGEGGTPDAGLPSPEKMASVLARVKELAVYFEFADGVAVTLESLLGPGPMERAARLLLSTAERGALAMRQARARQGATDPDRGCCMTRHGF